MNKTLDNEIELRRAQLVLKDAETQLRSTVYLVGCTGNKVGHKQDRIDLADSMAARIERIDAALDCWKRALRYYNSLKKDQAGKSQE